MAGFWGSNRMFLKTKRDEGNLAQYCSRKSYDIIVIDTLSTFFDKRTDQDKGTFTLRLN